MAALLSLHVAAAGGCHVCRAWDRGQEAGGRGGSHGGHGAAGFFQGRAGSSISAGERSHGCQRELRIVAVLAEGTRGRGCRQEGECGRENFRSHMDSVGRSVLLFLGTAAATATWSAVARAAEDISCKEEFGGADPNTVIVIACVAEFLALTGAAVGGILARQRKQEVEVINAQLRQINISLRKQARLESYAPTLTYAPVGAGVGRANGGATPGTPGGWGAGVQVAEAPAFVGEREREREREREKEEVIRLLKAGKRRLREQNAEAAVGEFEAALKMAQKIGDRVEEKKAARGLGASFQRLRQYREAIKHHKMVLEVSHVTGEPSGDTEAYGAIADCYTELGDLECAAKYYDRYIALLNQASELDNQE